MEENREIVVKQEYSFEKFAQEVELMTKVCKQLMSTKHYNALGEAGVFAILQRSKALNIDPFDALNGGLYYINGKVGMSTELMASLIRRAGHSVTKDPKSDDTICILHARRKDSEDVWTSSFSMIDADRAGLKKNMFLKYPAVMLYNRAMSMLARQFFPDVIKGCGYEKDELEEIEVRPENRSGWVVSTPKVEVPILEVTDAMEAELKELLIKDTEFKGQVDEYMGKNSFTELSQLSYKDFIKILKRAKERAKGGNNDTTESKI